MEQDQDIKKKKIRRFQEVELRESEFRKACELDSDEFKNIRNEYFKRTFVNHLIWIIIWAAVFALWPAGVIYKVYDRSEAVGGVLILLVAIGAAMCTFLAVRCIFSLVIISKINKQDFYWHEGHITRRKRLWTLPYLRMDFYYLVDDEYCSRTVFDPFYFKATEVYFLYFPDFMKSSLMGGIVVRKKGIE
jgi:hypothetical protein